MAAGKRKFTLKWKPLITFIIMGFVCYTFGEQMIKTYQIQKEIGGLEQQINLLQSKNSNLKKTINNLDSDAYVEKMAREKLGLVKPGEKIILRASPSESAPVVQPNTTPVPD